MDALNSSRVWFLALIMIVSAYGTARADIESGLVVHYDFESLTGLPGEEVEDRSGNDHDGMCVGDPFPTESIPGLGQAVDLDGSGDYIETYKTAMQLGIGGNDPRTVTCWAYVRTFTDAGLYDCGNSTTLQGFSLRTLYNTPNRWRIQYWGTDWDFKTDTGMGFTTGAAPFSSHNTWVLFAHTHDNSGTKIYANSELIVDWPVTLDTLDNITFKLAFWNNSTLDCILDEVRIYNRALSADDVQELYEYRYGMYNYNLRPQVDAGPDQILVLPNETITLDGTVSDDGIGDPNGYLFTKWSYLSGPGPVRFDPNEFILNPTITFTYNPGFYIFELYASDGDKSDTDVVVIILNGTILGDLDGNNRVDLLDLKYFCEKCPAIPGDLADLNGDHRLDLEDYSQLAGNWLKRGPSIVINEFLASNTSTEPPDPQGQYDDWIELINPTDKAIDVGGMYLTDDLSNPTKWQFPTDRPDETTISAYGYLLVWADGQPSHSPGLHANFELNASEGEEIGLYDTDGTLLDSITFDSQVTDVSFGRDPDASETWYTLNPTPGGSNALHSINMVADTKFSVDRGFYVDPIQVEITCATEGATIFYTTNFAEP